VPSPRWPCRWILFTHRELRGSTVVLPLGSFEDHGEEAMMLDTLLALEASCRLAQRCNWLVAWPLGYGFSPEHRYSVSLDEDLVARLVLHIARGLEALGARRVVVLDAHYGHREAVMRATTSRGYVYINVWDLVAELGYYGFSEQLAFEKELGIRVSLHTSESVKCSYCGVQLPGASSVGLEVNVL